MEKIEITLATRNTPLSVLIAQVSQKLKSNPWKNRLWLTTFKQKTGNLHLEYDILNTLDKSTKIDNLE